MSTKRTRLARAPKARITNEVLDLFRRAKEIEEAGGDEFWEHEGGRKREYYEVCVELDWGLNRRPWQTGIFDVDVATPPPPPWLDDDRDEAGAIELRRRLEALA